MIVETDSGTACNLTNGSSATATEIPVMNSSNESESDLEVASNSLNLTPAASVNTSDTLSSPAVYIDLVVDSSCPELPHRYSDHRMDSDPIDDIDLEQRSWNQEIHSDKPASKYSGMPPKDKELESTTDTTSPATDPPLPDRPGEHWEPGYSPAAELGSNKGEICRPGPPVGGMDYKQSRHPFKVFVGGVPLGAKEQDIFDLFEREVGIVMHCQLVLAMDQSGSNQHLYHRGYAFVTFKNVNLRERCLTRRMYHLLGKAMEVKSMGSNQPPPTHGSSMARDASHHPSYSHCYSSSALFMPPPSCQTHMVSGRTSSVICPGARAQDVSGDVPPDCKLFVALKSGVKVQVGAEAPALEEADMAEHFGHYGTIVKVVIVKDKETGASKGYGFIYYKEPTGPQVAMMAGREHMIANKTRVELKPFLRSRSTFAWDRPTLPMQFHPSYSSPQNLQRSQHHHRHGIHFSDPDPRDLSPHPAYFPPVIPAYGRSSSSYASPRHHGRPVYPPSHHHHPYGGDNPGRCDGYWSPPWRDFCDRDTQ